jgi:hypothetical protein
VLATTGEGDAQVQKCARTLSATAPFAVEVWSWGDIWRELYQREKLLDRILADYWPLLFRLRKKIPPRIAPSRLTLAPGALFGREAEMVHLTNLWQGDEINVVAFIAWGGVGKTSLVGQWAAALTSRADFESDYFDWSFFSQGTRDHSNSSADHFIDSALRHFGDEAMADSKRGAWEKGARLAEILASRRALLVVDGLEPLQHAPGPLAGELKDPALTALLRGWARSNAGLCVVTSRESVTELGRWPAAIEKNLEGLSLAAGVELLQSLGVKGGRMTSPCPKSGGLGRGSSFRLRLRRSDRRQRLRSRPGSPRA